MAFNFGETMPQNANNIAFTFGEALPANRFKQGKKKPIPSKFSLSEQFDIKQAAEKVTKFFTDTDMADTVGSGTTVFGGSGGNANANTFQFDMPNLPTISTGPVLDDETRDRVADLHQMVNILTAENKGLEKQAVIGSNELENAKTQLKDLKEYKVAAENVKGELLRSLEQAKAEIERQRNQASKDDYEANRIKLLSEQSAKDAGNFKLLNCHLTQKIKNLERELVELKTNRTALQGNEYNDEALSSQTYNALESQLAETLRSTQEELATWKQKEQKALEAFNSGLEYQVSIDVQNAELQQRVKALLAEGQVVSNQLAEAGNKLRDANAESARAVSEYRHLLALVEQEKPRFQQLEMDASQANGLRQENQSLRQQLEDATAKLAPTSNATFDLEQQTRLQAQIKALEDRNSELMAIHKANVDELQSAHKAEVDAINASLKERADDVETATIRNKSLLKENEKFSEDLVALNNKLSEAEGLAAIDSFSISSYQEEIRTLLGENTSLQSRLDTVKQSSIEIKEEVTSLRANFKGLTGHLKLAREILRNFASTSKSADERIATLEKELAEAHRRKAVAVSSRHVSRVVVREQPPCKCLELEANLARAEALSKLELEYLQFATRYGMKSEMVSSGCQVDETKTGTGPEPAPASSDSATVSTGVQTIDDPASVEVPVPEEIIPVSVVARNRTRKSTSVFSRVCIFFLLVVSISLFAVSFKDTATSGPVALIDMKPFVAAQTQFPIMAPPSPIEESPVDTVVTASVEEPTSTGVSTVPSWEGAKEVLHPGTIVRFVGRRMWNAFKAVIYYHVVNIFTLEDY
ncbi:hypothetical protein NHQ30_002930 [Ciborinia camelliae]|nr:hypothetical protein NHQ30_002930 [Ciborinia camelliae]